MLNSVEMTKILKHDTKPIYPVPETLLDNQQQQFGLEYTVANTDRSIKGLWTYIFPDGHLMIDVFNDLLSATELAHRKAAAGQTWATVDFLLTRMYPIIKLIASKSQVELFDSWGIVQEASRLGVFLFLGEIRRRCGALGVSTTLFVAKLKSFMSIMGNTIDWHPCHPILLWILFFGTVESWGLSEQDWFLEEVLSVAKRMNILSWVEIAETVRRFLWIDNIYAAKVDLIGTHLMAEFV